MGACSMTRADMQSVVGRHPANTSLSCRGHRPTKRPHIGCLTHRAAIRQPAGVNSLAKYSGYPYAVLRIVAGLLFACHGGQKILGFPPVANAMQLDPLGLV